ncbi:MAG TPA: glycosyltransferase family 39 protein [Opitutaceae bacterium]|nr:glycosyltransferase family 39 protein [Opitutaceae bacterium]
MNGPVLADATTGESSLEKRWSFLRRWPQLRHWALACLLIIIAGLLDLRVIRSQTLWVDELFSLAIATGHSVEHPARDADRTRGDFFEAEQPIPLGELRRYIAKENPPATATRAIRATYLSDTNPPLYYLLLSVWLRIVGTTDSDLRAFSVAWFLACIPLVLALARRVEGSGAQISAGLLFIFSPIAVYYSTEGRMYSMLWFWLVSTAWFTLGPPGRPRNWLSNLGWILTSAAGFLTHYFFLFPWCAMFAFLLWRSDWRDRLRVGLSTAVVGMAIFPWYRLVPSSLSRWRITQDWLSFPPSDFSRLGSARDLALQFFSNDGHYLWWDHPVARAVLLWTLGLLAVVVLFRIRTALWRENRLLLWLWFAASWAGPLVFDLARHTYTAAVPRYAISALPAAVLLIAVGLRQVNRLTRYALLGVLLAAWSFSITSILENPARDDQPFWKLGQVLDAQATEHDLILVHSIPTGAIGVARYTQSHARIATWVEQLGNRKLESLPALTTGFRRIFLVRLHEVGAPAPVEDWLRRHATVREEAKFGLIRLIEFQPNQGATFP